MTSPCGKAQAIDCAQSAVTSSAAIRKPVARLTVKVSTKLQCNKNVGVSVFWATACLSAAIT